MTTRTRSVFSVCVCPSTAVAAAEDTRWHLSTSRARRPLMDLYRLRRRRRATVFFLCAADIGLFFYYIISKWFFFRPFFFCVQFRFTGKKRTIFITFSAAITIHLVSFRNINLSCIFIPAQQWRICIIPALNLIPAAFIFLFSSTLYRYMRPEETNCVSSFLVPSSSISFQLAHYFFFVLFFFPVPPLTGEDGGRRDWARRATALSSTADSKNSWKRDGPDSYWLLEEKER